ncbi:Uncharacterized protein TCM_025489 [Theobroma cacao]|uniref:Reverse transcriptase Ty1/copia-type domain-containing protein n=1 Tax=Theobroma cacao TaxID=3641 RepID=A0A061EZ94_THECC|nr:Uncharacterized protein TCM_025489 [Theobroma cacao]
MVVNFYQSPDDIDGQHLHGFRRRYTLATLDHTQGATQRVEQSYGTAGLACTHEGGAYMNAHLLPRIVHAAHHQVITYDKWIDAMKNELDALEYNKTWTVVSFPDGAHTVGRKWVYKIKLKANGSIERYKAPLVANGNSQLERFDSHETLSPIAKHTTGSVLQLLECLEQITLCLQKLKNGEFVALLVYVDDIIIASSCVEATDKFMDKPTTGHLQATYRVLKYLKKAPGQGILLSSTSDIHLTVYINSDWAGCRDTGRPVTSFTVFLGHSLISWKSKKQGVVARCSAKAEYRAMVIACSEVVWLLCLLKDFDSNCLAAATMYCDNQVALHISRNPTFHERTKHIEVDYHFIREKMQAGVILP